MERHGAVPLLPLVIVGVGAFFLYASLGWSVASAETVGPNLVPNPELEIDGASGLPTSWNKGGYGSNTRTHSYPAPGFAGRGVAVTISNYASGDAKWYFDHAAVKAGATYRFSDRYLSDAPSVVTVQFKKSDGSFSYADIATLPASTGQFAVAAAEVTVPAGVVSATVFHLVKQNGTLTTDSYELYEVAHDGNFLPNPGFEFGGEAPSSWKQGRWGAHAARFSYPAVGEGGGKAVEVTMADHQSGDAKWFATVSLPPGTYRYSDEYMASVPTVVTVKITDSNGDASYHDIAHPEASAAWATASGEFVVPEGTAEVSFFHLINKNGTLTIDNVSATAIPSRGIFKTGAVTIRLDDNWASQYARAFPKLDAVGFKGTLYAVSKQIFDEGFTGYMSLEEIKDVYARGHEIGAHTRTHRDLTTLSPTERESEIRGSRDDILSWGVGSVLSFAYPFGAYTPDIINLVQAAGFESAASSNGGAATVSSDPYRLERRGLENTTTFGIAKQWIDEAIASREWLILATHDIQDACPSRYCVATSVFNQIVDYLAAGATPVVTVSEALASLRE